MEIGKQIKKLRADNHLSQDELAEKIYVSRQTISNWVTNKSYPDVKSLLLVSNLFHTSLDTLVKGDIQEMKQEIKSEDMHRFSKEANSFAILLICTILLPVPLAHFGGYIGWGIWAVIAALGVYYAFKVEKLKKNFNVQTYKEVLAFVEGKSLDKDVKNQEQGKRSYQKALLAIGAAILAVTVALIMRFLFKYN